MPRVYIRRGNKPIFNNRVRLYLDDYRVEPFVRAVLEELGYNKYEYGHYRVKQDGKYLLSRTQKINPMLVTYIYLQK